MTLTQEQQSFFSNAYGDFWPFIQRTDFERDPLLREMEQQCHALGIYSIGPWFGRLLNFLVRFGGVESALEFGTATGYSAVWIARGLAPGGRLVTIERDARLAALAGENLSRAGLPKTLRSVLASGFERGSGPEPNVTARVLGFSASRVLGVAQRNEMR